MNRPCVAATLPVLGALLASLGAVAPAAAETATVPVDVGLGPAAYVLSGPVFDDQPLHYGVKLNVLAIIDQATLQKNQNRIPARYRKMAKGLTEVRYSPYIWIPDALIISPKIERTGLYGVTWRPLSVGTSAGSPAAQLRLQAGLLITYMFLHSSVLPTTHFVRPGVDLVAEIELKPSDVFLISFGWASGFYVPQRLGSFEVGQTHESLWHFGQAFVKLHFRFPYEARM